MAVGFLLATPRASSAEIFGFGCITLNDADDCATLEAQITVEVTEGSGDTVLFRFTNTGTEASSITEIYFDDVVPLLGDPAAILSASSGVSFSLGDPSCSPGNLPGGNEVDFEAAYCAEPNAPSQPNGVNPTEYLVLSYTLLNGATFDDVIAALYAGTLNIGVRVQGFEGGGSEGGTIRRVPEPTSLLFVTTGLILGGLGLNRRRKR